MGLVGREPVLSARPSTIAIAAIAALALGACGGPKATPTDTMGPSSSPSASTSTVHSPAVAPPPFVCGAKPTCPADHPRGEHPLAEAIRSEVAAGKLDRAAALVVCAREEGLPLRIETDMGFAEAEPSVDSKHLIVDLPSDDVVRVFDAQTWTETLRLDGKALSASDARVLLTDRANRSTIWDLAKQEPQPSTIPVGTRPNVSARGTAVFWGERAPRRTLAIALASSTVRVPIDGIDADTALVELPDGKFLASTRQGRHWVVDPAAGKVVRSFVIPESEIVGLGLADRSLALLDVGKFIEGFDFLVFAPSSPPMGVSLNGNGGPKPLAGPGCPRSKVVAVSDDGGLVVTRAREAWCLFDLPGRNLLGTVASPMHWGGPTFPIAGTFVGPRVAVVSVGGTLARLRVDPGASPALVDLGPFGGEGALLEPRSSRAHAAPLVAPPVDRAWVGYRDTSDVGLGGAPRLAEVRADGTSSARAAPVSLDRGGLMAALDARREHLIGAERLERVQSCLLAPPGTCTELPLGGGFEIAKDGTWVVGPAAVGPKHWTVPLFSHRVGAMAIAEVATGREIYRHHAPGFGAVVFTSENELAAFGEDGTLLSCSLAAGTCKVAGVLPNAAAVATESGRLVVSDGDAIAAVPESTGVKAELLVPPKLDQRRREQDLLHGGRKVLVKTTERKLVVVDATTKATLREIPAARAVLSAATSTPRLAALTGRELAVFDLDTGKKLFDKPLAQPAMLPFYSAAAMSADGTRVVLTSDGAMSVFDVDGSKQLARWPVTNLTPTNVAGISPDGRWVGTVVEVSTAKGSPKPEDPSDAFLVLANTETNKLERIPLGRVTERGGGGLVTISITNAGVVAATFREGRALLVDPTRNVLELSRDARDAGLWLRASDGTVSSLGTVHATSRGLGCRIGPWMIPREACLPVVCASR